MVNLGGHSSVIVHLQEWRFKIALKEHGRRSAAANGRRKLGTARRSIGCDGEGSGGPVH